MMADFMMAIPFFLFKKRKILAIHDKIFHREQISKTKQAAVLKRHNK